METFITFSRMTEKGHALPPEKAPEILAKVMEIVEAYGGKLVSIWATTGRFDFVSIVEYPSADVGFKAHTKITELGVLTLESSTAFPVEAYIEAAVEKKVPALAF